MERELHGQLLRYQDADQPIGLDVEFFKYGSPSLLGLMAADALEQLDFFATTGSGGLYAVWNLPDGRRPVVYFCDEGVDHCLVAKSYFEFLKMLAVGHDGFPCDGAYPPDLDPEHYDVDAVRAFRTYVSALSACDMPDNASKLAIHNSSDYPDVAAFFNESWIDRPVDVPSHPTFGERAGEWIGKKLKRIFIR